PYLEALDPKTGDWSGLVQAPPAAVPALPAWTPQNEIAVTEIVKDSAKRAGLSDFELAKLAALANPVSENTVGQKAKDHSDHSHPARVTDAGRSGPGGPELMSPGGGSGTLGSGTADDNLARYNEVRGSVKGDDAGGSSVSNPEGGSSDGGGRF